MAYEHLIAELQEAVKGLEHRIAAGTVPDQTISCIECMVISEELLEEVYHTYFSAKDAPDEDKAAAVLFELATQELVTPYLVEEYMEAQRAVQIFRLVEQFQDNDLYKEYLSKIPIFCATLKAVVPVIEKLPYGLEIAATEIDTPHEL
jgi:hypothetical protein